MNNVWFDGFRAEYKSIQLFFQQILEIRKHDLIFKPQIQVFFHIFSFASFSLSLFDIPQIFPLKKPNHILNNDKLILIIDVL